MYYISEARIFISLNRFTNTFFKLRWHVCFVPKNQEKSILNATDCNFYRNSAEERGGGVLVQVRLILFTQYLYFQLFLIPCDVCDCVSQPKADRIRKYRVVC